MPRVVHFDLYAQDPERMSKFYSDTFGWKLEKWEDPSSQMEYWMVMTGDDKKPGINGGMSKKSDMPRNVLTIDVPDIDEYVEKIKKNGGEITMEKTAIPKVGWFAAFKDSEGELMSIMQTDMEAK
ncbi:MAG: VOC family protein [Parcubacteria group bacterium]